MICYMKQDDGKLSLDEFQAFFSDGTLNEEELEKLFHSIDSDNTSDEGYTQGMNNAEDRTTFLQNLPIDDGPFTASELARTKSTVREGKSAGPDGIPPEVLKYCDLDDLILDFCNLALLHNMQPDIWSLSNIIPVPSTLT
ncbi:hypothetical protein JOQ06_002474 [Pogonophryne albipinna]|uniref:EF-hand domain-containing protein n=1 Tax=Pogonophryne albipinna TaxID=1090488 RepID=A0AAD6FLA6_9TELE|nr:hypothetical protein JOQ06_002474 [Pogonophryne albipinna]